MDFSYYQQDLKWGKTYHNYRYEEVDVFNFIKSQGINTVSVRVMVNPEKSSSDAKYFTLENAAKTIKAANASSLNTNMILFYSDDYTYANSQTLPSAWKNSDNAATEAQNYTRETLNYLKNHGAVPSMITIGNEINYNFLNYTDGNAGNNAWLGWKAMADISNSIKMTCPSTKIGIGLAAPDNPTGIQWSLQKLNEQNVNYDYVGINLYTWDGFNESTYTKQLVSQFEQTQATANKNNTTCYIQNIKYPRYSNTDDSVTPEKQAQKIYDLLAATSTSNNAGGVIIDQGEYVGSWNSFFDDDRAVISLASFAYALGTKLIFPLPQVPMLSINMVWKVV